MSDDTKISANYGDPSFVVTPRAPEDMAGDAYNLVNLGAPLKRSLGNGTSNTDVQPAYEQVPNFTIVDVPINYWTADLAREDLSKSVCFNILSTLDAVGAPGPGRAQMSSIGDGNVTMAPYNGVYSFQKNYYDSGANTKNWGLDQGKTLPPAWSAGTQYKRGQVIYALNPPRLFYVQTAGTSGLTSPTFSNTNSISDNTVTWDSGPLLSDHKPAIAGVVQIGMENHSSNLTVRQPIFAASVIAASHAGCAGFTGGLSSTMLSGSTGGPESQDVAIQAVVQKTNDSETWGFYGICHEWTGRSPTSFQSVTGMELDLHVAGPELADSHYSSARGGRFGIVISGGDSIGARGELLEKARQKNTKYNLGDAVAAIVNGDIYGFYVSAVTGDGITGSSDVVDWSSSAPIADGHVTWTKGAKAGTQEIGAGIYVGNSPGTKFGAGLLLSSEFYNAAIDLHEATLYDGYIPRGAAAIRLGPNHPIDFSCVAPPLNGPDTKTQNLHTLKYNANSGALEYVISGIYNASTGSVTNLPPVIGLAVRDDGGISSLGKAVLATGGQGSLRDVSSGFSNAGVTIGYDHAKNAEADLVVGQTGMNVYATDGAGNIANPLMSLSADGLSGPAAIRLASNNRIDFSSVAVPANGPDTRDLHTLRYNASSGALEYVIRGVYNATTNSILYQPPVIGLAVRDDGGISSLGKAVLATGGQASLQNVNSGFSNAGVTIGYNHTGNAEADLVVGQTGLNVYATDGAGNIGSPLLSVSAAGLSAPNGLLVPGRVSDAKERMVVLSGTTTSANNPIVLTTDAGPVTTSNLLKLPNYSAAIVKLKIIGRDPASNQIAAWESNNFVVQQPGTQGSNLIPPTTVTFTELFHNSSYSAPTVTCDTTNNGIAVAVNAAGLLPQWVCTAYMTII